MNLLIDTHVLLWFMAGNERLSSVARRQIESSNNEAFVSIASLWEIAIKVSLNKLTLTQPLDELFSQRLERDGFRILPIEPKDTFQVARLPFHHRDPFDRLLIAQAIVNRMPLLSGDSIFDAYLSDSDVHRIW